MGSTRDLQGDARVGVLLAILIVATAACSQEPAPSSASSARAGTLAASSSPSPSPRATFRPRMVNVGGYRLAVYCSGRESPALVFEGGVEGPTDSADYSVVTDYMGSHGFDRTCWYDRAGLGRSEPRNKKRFDAVDVAGDLHALLHRIGIRPPYVLAGGSDGGLFVRVYRARYPREVGGMMLIDASEEHDPHLTLGMDLVPQGGSVLDMRTTLAEVRRAGDLGHLPLVVITAGQNAGDPEWMKSQRRLAALSTDSVHVVAVGAPHGVTDVVPALVTTLARELVTAIRKHSSLPPCSLDLRKLLGRCAR